MSIGRRSDVQDELDRTPVFVPLDAVVLSPIVNRMVNNQEGMDRVFAALADGTRRSMIRRLARGPAAIGELGRPHGISKPAVTKHVKVLERAGLVRREKHGRVHQCTLNPSPLRRAEAWIEHNRTFWERSLRSLAKLVEEPSNGERQ